MASAVRRIGVFTSGGDAPGMNAAIRSVVRTSLHMGIECIGIRRGYHGLITGDFTPLNFESVSGLSRRGGTMLYSARSEEFRGEAGQEKAAATCKLLGLDGPCRHRRRRHLPRSSGALPAGNLRGRRTRYHRQ